MSSRPNVKIMGSLESSTLKSQIKARKAELATTRMMRDQFEKNEKVALRTSRIYRDIHKQKQVQTQGALQRVMKGTGEAYVDSDRRIAVGLGAEDLKGQVEKYKDEMTTTGKLGENDLLQIHILIEQSKHDLRNHKPLAALAYVDKALRMDPSLLDVLELKCQALMKMNKYQDALDAANKILIELREPWNSKALAVKADAEYNLGNFEHALLYYNRAWKTASVREKDNLQKGIKLTELAVLNAVGPQVSHYFQNMGKMLPHMPKNLLSMPWNKVKLMVAVKDTKAGTKMKDRKFLSEMAKDKHYLEGLVKTFQGDKTFGETEQLIDEFNSALGFLGERREFWSQQKPAYPRRIRLSKGGATQKKASPLDDLLTKLMAEQRDKLLGTKGDTETAALFRVGSKRRQSIFGPMNAKTITTFMAYQHPKPAIL